MSEDEPVPDQVRLRDTVFPLLWFNSFTFTLISTAEKFTFIWLVIEKLKGPPWASGAVLFCLGLPVFLLVLPAGAIADRFDRRRLLMATQFTGMLVTFLSAVLIRAGWMTVQLALIPAALLGVSMAFGMPIRSSLVPTVVPKSLLMRAIVTNTVGVNIAMIVGPVIGGAAIRRWDVEAAFTLEAMLFGIGFLALIPVRLPERTISANGPRGLATRFNARELIASIREGLEFVWNEPVLRALFFLLSVGGFVMMGSASLLLPQIAHGHFGRDAAESSRLFAFMGIGMTISSLFLIVKRNIPRKGLAFLIAMSFGTSGQILQGFAPTYLILSLLLVVWGLCGGWYLNLNQTLIQSATPIEKMGRVMSLSVLANTGFAPLGSLVAGTIASTQLGPRHTLSLFGLVGVSCVLLTLYRSSALRNQT